MDKAKLKQLADAEFPTPERIKRTENTLHAESAFELIGYLERLKAGDDTEYLATDAYVTLTGAMGLNAEDDEDLLDRLNVTADGEVRVICEDGIVRYVPHRCYPNAFVFLRKISERLGLRPASPFTITITR